MMRDTAGGEGENSSETDRTTRRWGDVCFDACLFDFFAFIQLCFLWFGQFDASDSSSPTCLSIHSLSCLFNNNKNRRASFRNEQKHTHTHETNNKAKEKEMNQWVFRSSNISGNMRFFLLLQPPGAQLMAAPQYLQSQQQIAAVAQHQKRPAIADPKTDIPMSAYPVAAFSYPSASSMPMQFQQPYLTAVPMTCE
jgi:hypothetical protein